MRVLTSFILAVLSLSQEALCLYDSNSDITTFSTKSDFKKQVLESDGIWLIQFYANWCGHCKQFSSTYQEIASITKGVFHLGAVDAGSDGPQKRIASDYGVSGFPTMKLFYDTSSPPIDVQSRDPNEILQLLMETMQKKFQGRISGGSSSSSGSSSSTGGSGGGRRSNGDEATQLTESTFAANVYDNSNVVLVAFIAPWCGHCTALKPAWNEAASKLKGSGASLFIVDATEEESLARQYQVQGFPTIKIFPGGKGKTASSAMEYEGGRETEQIVQYTLAEVDRSGMPKEIAELTSKDVLKETCSSGSNTICVFAALPHIADSGADGRNKYRDILTAASKAVRGMPFEFLWFEGGSQPDLETALELTFGFPAVAVYSESKSVCAVHRSSFTESNIRMFLTGITTGKSNFFKLNRVPEIVTVDAWDGNDAEVIEEEFSLEDIMGDDWNAEF